jgi:iron only hydrogenase large subunit-like protein
MQEVVVRDVSGRAVLRAALAYGFRHIQNVVRGVRGGASRYDFVEVMACPSGALLCY